MTKVIDNQPVQAARVIDLGAASAETKGSNDHSVDGFEAQQLPKIGLSND